MRKSIFSDLWYKMVHSGSRLNLAIGINVLVFVSIGLISVVEFLFTRNAPIADWITIHLSMPADLSSLASKFWTPFTYMFTHREVFHILFNMLWLYWMGRIFEDFLNQKQFTFTYLAGGLTGALLYLLAYNLFPAFSDQVQGSLILGASASVSAIVIASATLLPEYTVMLMLFGAVKLKYLALAYIVLDLISIAGSNPGGSIAHLGGALLGFIYIKQLQNGNDWSKLFQMRKKLKVVSRSASVLVKKLPDQEIIDKILDKISASGYESLTAQEKEQLFKASKKNDR